jgi:hypothetical protein
LGREKFILGTWFCSPNSWDLRVVCQPPGLSFTVCGICTLLVPDSVSYSIRLLYSFRSFPSTMLFFLNWFLLLSSNTRRRRAGGHVPCRRKEDALGAEQRFARISPQFVYSWSSVLKLFRSDFLRWLFTCFFWLTGLRLNCFVLLLLAFRFSLGWGL